MIFKNSKDHLKALEIIENYSNSCPKCYSDNISNDDDYPQLTCHDCSHQFDEYDYMDKIHIIALLNVKGLPHIAKDIEEMTVSEYDDFLVNHIY